MVKMVKFKHKSRAKSVIIIVAALAVLAIGTTIFLLVKAKNEASTSNTSSSQSNSSSDDGVVSDGTQTSISDIADSVTSGDATVDEALTQLDALISGSTSSTDKAAIYDKKSEISYNDNDVKSALENAINAANSDATPGRYDYVAKLYEESGDNTSAIEYYQKALDMYSDSTAEADGLIGPDYFEQKIEDLQ